MKIIHFFLLVFIGGVSSTQTFEDPVVKYANSITPEELKSHLSIIASDYFEGRETGTIGLVRAAEYLSGEFQKAGIPPLKQIGGYFKEYPLIEFKWENAIISTKKNTFGFATDFYAYASSNNSLSFSTDEIVFLGFGIDDSLYSDYEGVDVKDKILLIASGEPVVEGKSIFTHDSTYSKWSSDWRLKVNAATNHHAKCVLIIDPGFQKIVSSQQWLNFLQGSILKLKSEYKPAEYCNNLFISEQMANTLLGKHGKQMKQTIEGINSDGKPAHFSVKTSVSLDLRKSERLVYADNVIAFVEGTDLADQIIVVSAHYDHLGKIGDSIYNGADDDGSGTSALLEMAEALMQAKRDGNGPRRSVMFIAFSGEEKGLLGSKSFVADPVFPLSRIMVDLNIDMIGRIDDAHLADTNYIYIIGSDFLSKSLHSINEAAAKTYTTLELDYGYNSTTDPNRYYYRSDHYNFAKNNIPVIFYFSGAHPDYHQPGDDVDKIHFNLMAERAQLVFYTLWILANQENRIQPD